MNTWTLIFERRSLSDARKLQRAGLWRNAQKLLDVLRKNPFQNPPAYEKLSGELKGAYSRRINKQHRLVYDVRKRQKTVRILRMWTHSE